MSIRTRVEALRQAASRDSPIYAKLASSRTSLCLTRGQAASILLLVAQLKSLSDQLRAAVQGATVTRYRLSQELGIDQAALSRFVNGERGLSLEAIDKLAAYLGLRLVGPRSKKGSKS